jgi:light-regulated signal transduction histidine kinase (bacteriophytochrome)
MAPQPDTCQEIVARALVSGLTEFSSRAAHDLLGPVNQAGSLLTLFVKRYRNLLDSEADTLLGFLQSASSAMEGTAAAARKYLEIAGRPPIFERVDLNASLASSLKTLEKSISDSGAAVSCESLPVVSADAAQMVIIFELLIGNSIKFCKRNEPPWVQISSRRADDAWAIAVADKGIGIDPEFNEAAFLPFKRLNGREYPGAGLGLAMAKLIAGMHGGNISIDSVPEQGTCVQFTVPAA